jgi:hypothetical protein
VTRVEDFAAYEFAVQFKLEVYRLIKASRGASKNQSYREQLEDAASGIEGAMSEGFGVVLTLQPRLIERIQDPASRRHSSRLFPRGGLSAGIGVGRALRPGDNGALAQSGTEGGRRGACSEVEKSQAENCRQPDSKEENRDSRKGLAPPGRV